MPNGITLCKHCKLLFFLKMSYIDYDLKIEAVW